MDFDFVFASDWYYSEYSEPPGIVSNEYVHLPWSVVTSTAQSSYGNLRFAYWSLNGVRQADGNGQAINPVVFEITNDTVAIASLVDEATDVDSDTVPDWYELFYYGNTDHSKLADTDGDGYSLHEEWVRGYNPHSSNALSYRVVERASPASTFTEMESYLGPGSTPYLTASRYGETDGFRFGYWEVDGVRKQDSLSRSSDPYSVPLVATQRMYDCVATFVAPSADTDFDSVPDWYELNHYGDLSQAGTADADGDGWSLTTEAAHDTHPGLTNRIVRQETIKASSMNFDFWHRFFFISDPYAKISGILSAFFSPLPPQNGTFHLAANSAPGLGDWDGDGDLDLFVTAPDATLTVFENIGSQFCMNLVDRSTEFAALGASSPSPTLALGDWSQDGKDDLALGLADGRVRIINSAGAFSGTVTSNVDYYISTGSPNAIPALADISRDGKMDLLTLLDDGRVRLYTNSGSILLPFLEGSYSDNILGASVPDATGLGSADIDYDGNLDVVVSDNQGRIWAFYGQAGGGYQLLSKVWAGTFPGFAEHLTLAIGDLDGDSDVDVIGGFSNGGLVRLLDPRLAPPLALAAHGGADSIRLEWSPNHEVDLDGYFVYRSLNPNGPFQRLYTDLVHGNHCVDTNTQTGVTYYYYLTAVCDTRMSGDVLPEYVESRPSNVAEATCNHVIVWMSDYSAKTNSTAVLRVNINHATGIAGQNLELRITYDPLVLRPLTQIVVADATVELTAISEGLQITDTAATANGELVIQGSSGVIAGEGHVLDVNFHVMDGIAQGTTCTNTLSYVCMENQFGRPLSVDSSGTAIFTLSSLYSLGDVDGDGDLDQDDFRYLVQLVAHRTTPIPEELSAGDLNGNNRLDHNDAQLLKRILQNKPRNPGD